MHVVIRLLRSAHSLLINVALSFTIKEPNSAIIQLIETGNNLPDLNPYLFFFQIIKKFIEN